MYERHEANYIQLEGYQNQNSYDSYSYQSHHDHNDSEKSLTKLNNDVKNDLEYFKRCITSMRTLHDKLFDRDDGKTTGVLPNKKSKTVNQEQQANVVFTESGKSDDSLKIQKDPPPSIIVNNKTEKDKPIKTSKKGYHVIKTNEYPFHQLNRWSLDGGDSLSLVDVIYSQAIDESVVEHSKSEEEKPLKEVDVTNEVERRVDEKPGKSVRENVMKNDEEELAGVFNSHVVGYYLKHRINEKIIEGLVENQKFNDSLSAARLGKMKRKTYNSLPRGPVHDSILKKK
ncbi:hypothetical protein Tco_0684005 [Tanacetum coccineum]